MESKQMHAAARDADVRSPLVSSLAVRQLFERHSHLLESHRQFLERFQQESQAPDASAEPISLAIQQTEWMDKCFADCRNAYLSLDSNSTKSPSAQFQGSASTEAPHSQPDDLATEVGQQPTKLYQEPYQKMDSSGLFMFDTVPTRPSEYLRDADPRSTPPVSKRRRSGETAQENIGPSRRKKARNSMGSTLPRNGDDVMHGAHGARSEAAEQEMQDVDDDDENSFVREVKELQKEKEAKWRKRDEKKRKRDSNGSDRYAPPSGQMEGMSIVNGQEPARKRQRTDQNGGAIKSGAQKHPKTKRSHSESRRRDKKSKRQRR